MNSTNEPSDERRHLDLYGCERDEYAPEDSMWGDLEEIAGKTLTDIEGLNANMLGD